MITPGDKVDQYHNVYWFDPTDMTPLINSPGHVKALEFLQELHKTGPAAQVGWSLGEAWDYFLRGKSVFVFSWGDVGALCQDTARSKIQGDCASAVLPSSTEYWDHQNQTWVKNDNPQLVGNTTGGSWHGVVSSFSDQPEAAYSFLSLMAIKPVSKWLATFGWDGVDPGYSYQMLEPVGEAKIEDYVKAGWDEADVKDYLKAYSDNFNAPTILTYLRIEGAPSTGTSWTRTCRRRWPVRRPRSRRWTTRRRRGSRSPIASAATRSWSSIRRRSATKAELMLEDPAGPRTEGRPDLQGAHG